MTDDLTRERIAEVMDVPLDLVPDPKAVREYRRAFEGFARSIGFVAEAFTRMLEDSIGMQEIVAVARAKSKKMRRTKRYNAKMSARAKR